MENIVYLMDCMEFLKTCPDKAFDLAIVDPPYGDGNQDVGGGVRFGQRFERYSRPQAQQLPQTGNKEEAEATGGTAGFSDGPSVEEDRGVTRTGGTWAAKYGKSIADWDKAPPHNTLRNFSECRSIASSGAETTSICRRQGTSSYGGNFPSRRISRWLWLNLHGRTSGVTQRCSTGFLKERRTTRVSIPRRNPLNFINGFCPSTRSRETGSLIRTWVPGQAA